MVNELFMGMVNECILWFGYGYGFASYLNNVLGGRVLIYINCEDSKFYSLSNYIVFFFMYQFKTLFF